MRGLAAGPWIALHLNPVLWSRAMSADCDRSSQQQASEAQDVLFRDDIISVCLSSAFHTTKAALPHMLEQKWGRIINTGAPFLYFNSP